MRFFDDGDLVTGILEWNILQALLRRAAQVVETCFLSVSTGVLGLVVLSSVQIFNIFGDANAPGLGGLSAREGVCLGLWSTWVLPQVVLVFYFVFRAAAITEKCSRVPSLINSSMCQGAEIDHEKQYIVQYISQSAAGLENPLRGQLRAVSIGGESVGRPGASRSPQGGPSLLASAPTARTLTTTSGPFGSL